MYPTRVTCNSNKQRVLVTIKLNEMSIQKIDYSSIKQLGSGQVVVHLTSAVKELVDNAIDAHASKIDVIFKDYGLESLEVVDDGDGINPEDFDKLGSSSSTSKIRSFADIAQLQTLGFRGEALSSLCNIADVSILTKQTKEPTKMAHRLTFDSSGTISSQSTERGNKGTTVTVSNLFYRLPVRRKTFERTSKREFSRAVSILQEYAIINDGILFTVIHLTKSKGGSDYKRSVIFRTTGSSIKNNIAELYGPATSDSMMPLDIILEPIEKKKPLVARDDEIGPSEVRISGFISQPVFGKGRSTGDRQHFYVNSRPCDQDKLAKVATEVYKQFNHVQVPALVCNILTSADCFDVNVTPDKRTVLLHGESALMEQFREQLYQLLDGAAHTIPKAVSSNIAVKSKGSTSLRQTLLQSTFARQSAQSVDIAAQSTGCRSISGSTGENGTEQPNNSPQRTVNSPSAPSIRSFMRPKPSTSSSHRSRPSSSLMSYATDPNIPEITPAAQEPEEPKAREHEEVEELELELEPEPEPESREPKAREEEIQEGAPKAREEKGAEEQAIERMDQEATPPIRQDNSKDVPATRGISRKVGRQKHSTLNSTIKVRVDMNDIRKHFASSGDSVPSEQAQDQNKMAIKAFNIAEDGKDIESKLDLTVHKEDFTEMEIVGQFNLGFILVRRTSQETGATDLFIIDQHASDEKFNFERLQRDTVLNHQRLVSPKILSLTAVEELAVASHPDVFRSNGFQIDIDTEAVPGQQCKLISLPYSKSTVFNESDIHELISLVQEDPSNKHVKCSKTRAMFAMRACRSSIMVGQPLTVATMEKVVRRLAFLDKPWNCPHGRPTLRHVMAVNQWKGYQQDKEFELQV